MGWSLTLHVLTSGINIDFETLYCYKSTKKKRTSTSKISCSQQACSISHLVPGTYAAILIAQHKKSIGRDFNNWRHSSPAIGFVEEIGDITPSKVPRMAFVALGKVAWWCWYFLVIPNAWLLVVILGKKGKTIKKDQRTWASNMFDFDAKRDMTWLVYILH